jgi:adenylate cyclase
MWSIVRFLDRLSDLGAGPEDSDDERLRHGTLIFASMVITLISLTWVATYFAYGYPTSAAIPALYQLITVVGLVVLARTRRFGVFRTTQLLAFLVLPALLQASLGGFVASSAMILWAIFTPLAALALQGLRRSVVWLVAFFAELVVLGLLDPRLSQDPAALPTDLVITFFVLNVMGLTLSAYVMLGYFVEQRERARRALEAERERSERLLLNVLPEPIAERLKVETGVIADHYDTVSVLFADLVGFTGRWSWPPTSWWPSWMRFSPRSTGSPMRSAWRRSRRSATPTWWRAGCQNRVRTTSRRSPGWRWRCGMRSRRSRSGPDGAGSPSGSGSTPDRWWRV